MWEEREREWESDEDDRNEEMGGGNHCRDLFSLEKVPEMWHYHSFISGSSFFSLLFFPPSRHFWWFERVGDLTTINFDTCKRCHRDAAAQLRTLENVIKGVVGKVGVNECILATKSNEWLSHLIRHASIFLDDEKRWMDEPISGENLPGDQKRSSELVPERISNK